MAKQSIKKIYATAYLDNEEKTLLGHSVDIGFKDLDSAINAMGQPFLRSKQYAIYRNENAQSMLLSTFPWSLPE